MRIAAGMLALALTSPLVPEASSQARPVPVPQTVEVERTGEMAEEARRSAEIVRNDAAIVRQQAEVFRLAGGPVPVQGPLSANAGDSAYASGLGAMQQGQYDRAISQFDQAIACQSPRADGALYWRAFAQYRLRQSDPALSTITQLRRDHGQSRYLADAKVLETEVRRAAGLANQPLTDDEVKVLAIQGVQRSAQAVPALEGVLTAANSLVVKRRALAALSANIADPRSRTVLLGYAKGSGNPDLQIEAIRVLGTRREAASPSADLRTIYSGHTDTAIRLAVISALGSLEDADSLVTLARAETSVELKREIVRRISDLAPRSKVAADFLTGVLR